MSRALWSRSAVLGLAALFSACESEPKGEALALIEVSYAADLPAFDQIWFSVEGQPTIATRKVPRSDREAFTFGYAIAGLSGRYTIKADVRQGETCVVGEGNATPELTPGKNSDRVKLMISRVDRGCGAPPSEGMQVDGVAPSVVEYRPAHLTADIKRGEPIVVVFSEAIDPKSLAGQIRLESGGTVLASKVELDGEGKSLSVTPEKPLPFLSPVTLTVGPEVRDRAGNALGKVAPASFTTADGTWSAPLELFRYDMLPAMGKDWLMLALAASGAQAVVVWQHSAQGVGQGTVFNARRFDGTKWEATHEIARSPSDRADPPAVAMNESGRIAILYLQTLATGERAIRGRVFDPGRGWDSNRGPFEHLPAGVEPSMPTLAMSKGGLALGVWAWSRTEMAGPVVTEPVAFLPRISATTHDGLDFSVATEVGGPGSSVAVTKDLPRVTADANGNANVVWLERGPAGQGLMSSRFTPTGGWGAPRALVTAPEGGIFPLFDVVADGKGNATAIWGHATAASFSAMFAAHYDVVADKWSAPAVGSSSAAVPLQVVANAGGQTAALWGTPPNVLTMRRLEQGAWSPNVATRTGEGRAALGIDDRGHVLVQWMDRTADKKVGVFVAREHANGVSGKPLQLNKDSADSAQLAVLPDGRAFAAWSEGTPARLMVSRFE